MIQVVDIISVVASILVLNLKCNYGTTFRVLIKENRESAKSIWSCLEKSNRKKCMWQLRVVFKCTVLQRNLKEWHGSLGVHGHTFVNAKGKQQK